MAKKESTMTVAPKDNATGNGGAALAKAPGVQMAGAMEMPADWLSDVLGDDVDLGVTGTEEMDSSDVRLPAWLLNSKKEDKASGRQAPDDVFWNTITEHTKEQLRLVVLTNHKSRIWREEDKASRELVVRCSSWDCVEGEMQTGAKRACKGCPDYEWRTKPDGKRARNCTDVNNLISLDRETRDVCVVKVKTTAVKGFRVYYQSHFHKKRAAKTTDPKTGKTTTRIVDNPFFAAETIVDAEKKVGGGFTWYVPRFSFGGALPREEILAAAEIVKGYLPDYLERAAKTADVETVPDAIDTTGGTVGSDASDFSDDDGPADGAADVVPSSAGGGAQRF